MLQIIQMNQKKEKGKEISNYMKIIFILYIKLTKAKSNKYQYKHIGVCRCTV